MTTFSDIETKHKEDTTMKRREVLYALAAGLFLSVSGCVVAERGVRGRRETYYYYPDYEVYFYPNMGRYYWRERDEWRHGDRPPPRYTHRGATTETTGRMSERAIGSKPPRRSVGIKRDGLSPSLPFLVEDYETADSLDLG
jgi:hypothetical protein